MDTFTPAPSLDARRPIAIAVLAMGGQGGGVLVDWITALAESQGYLAQSTSVIGAELMEAGRAMQRGLVSPDRTTLIASSHRAYAVVEKAAPGDGAGDPVK